MNSKEYTLPDGKKAVFEYDACGVGKMTPECMDELMGMIADRPQWITVSERLPEKSMRCLVVVGRFNFTEIATYSDLMGIIDHKIFYQGDVGHDNFANITQYVKAWMPLPERYTESDG
jgi:hypothetical protein